jgi:hypothetical protein
VSNFHEVLLAAAVRGVRPRAAECEVRAGEGVDRAAGIREDDERSLAAEPGIVTALGGTIRAVARRAVRGRHRISA